MGYQISLVISYLIKMRFYVKLSRWVFERETRKTFIGYLSVKYSLLTRSSVLTDNQFSGARRKRPQLIKYKPITAPTVFDVMPTFPGETGERMYACTYNSVYARWLVELSPVRHKSVRRLPAAEDSIAAFRATHQFIKLSTARTGLLTYSFGDGYMARCRALRYTLWIFQPRSTILNLLRNLKTLLFVLSYDRSSSQSIYTFNFYFER